MQTQHRLTGPVGLVSTGCHKSQQHVAGDYSAGAHLSFPIITTINVSKRRSRKMLYVVVSGVVHY